MAANGSVMTGKLISFVNLGMVENYLDADEITQSDASEWQRHNYAFSLTHYVKLKEFSSLYHPDGSA